MRKNILVFFIFITLFGFGKPEVSKDSLIHCLEKAKNDSNKVNLLLQLFFIIKNNNPTEALQFAQQAVALGEELNFKVIKCYDELGWTYKELSNYEKALEIYYKAEAIAKTYQSPIKEISLARINTGLASVYGRLKNYDLAINKIKNSIKFYSILNDKSCLASNYLNFGNYCYYKSNYSAALTNYKISEDYLNQIHDSVRLPICYNSIGSILFQIKNYQSALEYYIKFYNHTIKNSPDDDNSIAVAKQNMGQTYFELGETQKAIDYTLEAIALFKKLNDFENLYTTYKKIATYYSHLGNFEVSNNYYELYANIKDSVFNENMQNTILEMSIKHESEQKEKENQVLVLENRNKKQLIYFALGGCLFLVIILFFILRGYYLKQKSLKKEKTLNELKSQFISTASHEFLTPLTTIITSAELIEKYLTTNEIEKKLNHVNKIKTSVLILKSIFSDFLTQEKIKYGKINNAPQLINIQECVDQIITANNTHFANHKLIYTHTGIIKGAYLDKTIFSTIITNLISNACKYSPIESEITILSNQQENSISISIKDKGIGIPKKDQAFLFEPFYRATNVTNIGGTGLGLNITKKLTTLIGGKLTFTSEENIETTFNINIPL